MDFSEKDASDLAKVKEVMLTKALDGDAHAARAFATILTTQKELSKGAAPAPEKPVAIAAEIPAPVAATAEMEKGSTGWRSKLALETDSGPYAKDTEFAPN
jgi:hypothetical protein